MHENRAAVAAKNIGGEGQEIANWAKGTAHAQAREDATEIADAVSEAAATAHRVVSAFGVSMRNAIETQPYTAILVAFGLGWLWGKMHRPF